MWERVLQLALNGLMAGSVLAVPAIGFTTIFAVLRFANFSVAGHMAVGAFAAWVLNVSFGLPAWLVIPGAFASAGLVGIATHQIALQPMRGAPALTLAIASIAVNIAVESVLRFVFGSAPHDFDIPLRRDWDIGPLHVGPQQLQNAAVAVVTMVAVFAFLSRTMLGKAMRAVADNPGLADSKGINPDAIARLAVGLGMGLVGIGGVLIGLDTSVDPLVGFRSILSVFAAAVLGGLGNIPGAVLGGLAIGLAEELSLVVLPATYKAAVGFLAILVMLNLRPEGLLARRTA